MEKPLLSVLIPVYNVAAWLPRCLDSVCSQSYANLQILCVDDGSTDESPAILAAYAARDARITVIRQENGGLSAARNTALEHATGEWIAGVDSDDYLAPGIFEQAMTCVNDEVDMVSFGVRCVDDTGLEQKSFQQQFAVDEVVPMSVEAASRIHVCFWSSLWRRSVVVEHGIRFPFGLVHEDDAFFYQFVPHVRSLALCTAVGYYYVLREGSIMHSGQSRLETTRRYMKVMRYVYEQYRSKGVNPADSPWYQLFVSRVYGDRYHVHTPEERAEMAHLFSQMLGEQGLLPALSHDYRFRCMMPVRGLRRCYLSRYLNSEVLRFLGLPIWMSEYRNGKKVKQGFILWQCICRKLGITYNRESGTAC